MASSPLDTIASAIHDYVPQLEKVQLDLQTLALAAPAVLVAAHVLPYLYDSHRMRKYPGPFWARFSDVWLGWVSKNGHRSEIIHELHEKYGPFVRLAPNHLSIADPDALQTIYAHGNGALKSEFYDAFVSIRRGVFNTRDRDEHARKRKIVAHIFSQKSVMEFEPHTRHYISLLIKQWDRLCDAAVKGGSGHEGEGWRGKDGWLWLDCLPWANYLAFDIIGDLAFGAPFGMIEAARDMALVAKNQESVMKSYGKEAQAADIIEIPAVKILNGRGEFSMSMGVLPGWWRPIVRTFIPWYRRGGEDVRNLAGIAIAAVARRMAHPTDRVDLLSKLEAARDGDGKPMSREELTAEALTLLIAGSDTTSNSTCAIIYHLARNPHVQAKLHKELDEQLGTEDEMIATSAQIKRLPYLDACINEGLRIHSTSALGLPRVVPKGGMTVLDQYFPEGTVLSVPSFSIHRNTEVWGEDVEVYRPERWFERDFNMMQKTFNPFSAGPRACVGRNLAFLELQIILASLLRRYEFVLENPNQTLETREGFLRKPLGCRVGIRRRDV